VQKINPNDLKTVVKVYDGIMVLLRDPENGGLTKVGIQSAIKNNKIYNGFRWNFIEADEDGNIVNFIAPSVAESNPTNSIAKLNSTKTKILEMYPTKISVAKEHNMSKGRLLNYIRTGKMINDCYFVEYNKCPQKLLDEYDKPIPKVVRSATKKVVRTDVATNKTIIYRSLDEIAVKVGYIHNTVKDAIKNKTLLGGSMWEYYQQIEDQINNELESESDSEFEKKPTKVNKSNVKSAKSSIKK